MGKIPQPMSLNSLNDIKAVNKSDTSSKNSVRKVYSFKVPWLGGGGCAL